MYKQLNLHSQKGYTSLFLTFHEITNILSETIESYLFYYIGEPTNHALGSESNSYNIVNNLQFSLEIEYIFFIAFKYLFFKFY